MNTTLEEKKAKRELLNKTWEYLNDNFHKFTEANKIKIALALNLRSMPTVVEGEAVGNKIIIVRPNENKEELPNLRQRNISNTISEQD